MWQRLLVYFSGFLVPLSPCSLFAQVHVASAGIIFWSKFKDYGGQKLEIIVLNHFDVICLPPLVIVNLIFS